MLSGIVTIAAGIRSRLLDWRLEQFEERIAARLGLLAHVVIRSGSDAHPASASAASEGVAREAIERLARAAGFADADLGEIVDYGVMLVLVAIHICRQTNLQHGDVLAQSRRLLADAAHAVPAITPPPSFSESGGIVTAAAAVGRQASVMSGPDPAWSLISKAIETLRAEILAEIPADLLSEHNVLSSSRRASTTATPAAGMLLLTDGRGDVAAATAASESSSPEAAAVTCVPDQNQVPVVPIPETPVVDSSPPADYAPITAASEAGVPPIEPGSGVDTQLPDSDQVRYLEDILAALARLRDGQDSMTQELRQLKETIEEASGAFSDPTPSSSRVIDDVLGGFRKPQPAAAAAVAEPWQRLRKARISEIGVDPVQIAVAVAAIDNHAPGDAATKKASAAIVEKEQAVKAATETATPFKEMEIETPDDPWSDADRNQPSYRPSVIIAPLTSSSATSEAAAKASSGTGTTQPAPDAVEGKPARTPRPTPAAVLPGSIRDLVLGDTSDDRPARGRNAAVRHGPSDCDSSSPTPSPGRTARCSCGQQTRTPPRRHRRHDESATDGSAKPRTASPTPSSDEPEHDGIRRRRHRHRSPRRHRPAAQYGDGAAAASRPYRDDFPPPRRPYYEDSRARPPAGASPSPPYRPGGSWAPPPYAFPECCRRLGLIPPYESPLHGYDRPRRDLYRVGGARHLDCRYCQMERLGLRFKACSFCP